MDYQKWHILLAFTLLRQISDTVHNTKVHMMDIVYNFKGRNIFCDTVSCKRYAINIWFFPYYIQFLWTQISYMCMKHNYNGDGLLLDLFGQSFSNQCVLLCKDRYIFSAYDGVSIYLIINWLASCKTPFIISIIIIFRFSYPVTFM